MSDQNPINITSMTEPVVIPPKPSPTRELEREAEQAIAYLEQFTSSPRLSPDLRIAMNDIKNLIKNLKLTVARQSSEANDAHDKLVEIIRSQRLM